MIWSLIAAFCVIAWVYIGVTGLFEVRFLFKLVNFQPPQSLSAQRVRIVVAARNEEKEIAKSLESLFKIDYPNFEIVLVNDRSTDNTPQIMKNLAQNYPYVSVIDINELPPRWLGKNHAMHRGAFGAQDKGVSWLLFTDADVQFSQDILKKSISFAQEKNLDHLTASPELAVSSNLLRSVMSLFSLAFGTFVRPSKVEDPTSRLHVGIGSFNLVKSSVYESLGGHEKIRLRPDDDMKLGKLIKISGFKQMLVTGESLINVTWYNSIREMKIGLEKNIFAFFNYSLVNFLLFGTLFHIFMTLPILGLLFGPWDFKAYFLITLLVELSLVAFHSKKVGGLGIVKSLFYFVFAFLILEYIALRSIILTLKRSGMYWRNTFYSLEELRKNNI